MIGKWLAADPDILVLDEPTAGIDIGSKSEIIRAGPRTRARPGKAIIMISSELSELLTACDRILVMADGRVMEDLPRDGARRPGGPGRRRRAPAPGRRTAAADRIQKALTRGAEEVTMSTSETCRSTLARLGLANWRQNIIYIGFVVIFVVFAVTLHDKGFLNPNNLLNIVRQTAMIAVMAIAMTFVLSAGEIDLSVGAVAGLASVTTAMAIDIGGPVARRRRRPRDRPRGRHVQRLADHAHRHTRPS